MGRGRFCTSAWCSCWGNRVLFVTLEHGIGFAAVRATRQFGSGSVSQKSPSTSECNKGELPSLKSRCLLAAARPTICRAEAGGQLELGFRGEKQ